jgi:hypothetical protein
MLRADVLTGLFTELESAVPALRSLGRSVQRQGVGSVQTYARLLVRRPRGIRAVRGVGLVSIGKLVHRAGAAGRHGVGRHRGARAWSAGASRCARPSQT